MISEENPSVIASAAKQSSLDINSGTIGEDLTRRRKGAEDTEKEEKAVILVLDTRIHAL